MKQKTAAQKQKTKKYKKKIKIYQKQINKQFEYKQFILKIILSIFAKPKKRKAVKDPFSEFSLPKLRISRNGHTIALLMRFYE